MKKNVRKKDPNSTNSTGVLPLYHPCAQTSGNIIYSDGQTNGKMNSKSRIEIEDIIPKNSILASQKARKFQHFQKTSKVRSLYFDPHSIT